MILTLELGKAIADCTRKDSLIILKVIGENCDDTLKMSFVKKKEKEYISVLVLFMTRRLEIV